MNRCNGCTMCCKMLGIEELQKPAGKWCDHCTAGAGCNVYAARPRSCRTYTCTWLQSQESDTPWPIELRPDRCHVVVDYVPALNQHFARVHAYRPDAWRTPAVMKVLGAIMQAGIDVFVVAGEKPPQKLKLAEAKAKRR